MKVAALREPRFALCNNFTRMAPHLGMCYQRGAQILKGSAMKSVLLFALTISTTAFAGPVEESILRYSAHVHAAYSETLNRAEDLRAAIRTFTDTPSVVTQEMAKKAWVSAREAYGPTEAFRYYNGPIDADGGPEGLLNAWPLDEAYIDSVNGAAGAGIINNLAAYPQITKDLLISLNEVDGEKNISTGYHAIEFLLWGQDLFAAGPGQRPFTDYTSAPNATRRAQYLNVVADMLVDHVASLETAWRPNEDNYRREFESLAPKAALKKILTGVIFLAGDEISGERMYVAYDTRGQEDEQSCFSDMTHMDILWNYQGLLNVLTETRLLDLPELQGQAVSESIRARMTNLPMLLMNIPVPFDQAINDDVTGRPLILASVEELESLARDLSAASKLLGAGVDY